MNGKIVQHSDKMAKETLHVEPCSSPARKEERERRPVNKTRTRECPGNHRGMHRTKKKDKYDGKQRGPTNKENQKPDSESLRGGRNNNQTSGVCMRHERSRAHEVGKLTEKNDIRGLSRRAHVQLESYPVQGTRVVGQYDSHCNTKEKRDRRNRTKNTGLNVCCEPKQGKNFLNVTRQGTW